MDQDRRDAAAWAQEWRIRRKNRRLVTVIVAAVSVAAFAWAASYVIPMLTRSTFSSEEEMRKAMQGRYAYESSYEDVVIEGDDITLTYLSYSHYDRRYAEQYGYDAEEDSVYEDRIVEWDYRHGIIKTEWMGDYIVDKRGNLKRGRYSIFYRTDEPRPDPIDPSTLSNPEGSGGDVLSEEEEEAVEQREESIEETQDAAEEAGAEEALPDADTEA